MEKIKTEDRYKALIERRFSEDFEYVSCRVKDNTGRKNYYYITVKCKRCGEEKTATYPTFRDIESIRCSCQDEDMLRRSAEKYGDELYRSISADSGELGYIVGKELEEYVRASALYDRPNLAEGSRFVDFVLEYILNKYEKMNITQCKSCGLWLREKSMYHYDKRLCRSCNKKHQEEKKQKRQEEKNKRKYRTNKRR